MRSSPPWSGALSYWSRRSRSSPAETRTTGLVLVSSAGSSPNTRTPTVRSLELPRVPVEGFLDHVAQETGVPLAVAELRTGENPLELAANRSRVRWSGSVVNAVGGFLRLHGPVDTLANERLEYSTRTVNYLYITVARTVRPRPLTVAHLRMRPKGHRLLVSPGRLSGVRSATGGRARTDPEGTPSAPPRKERFSDMSQQGFSRRYFFYGSLLAGGSPRCGFCSTSSLKALGSKSPNEKLNLAAIGAGGQPAAELMQAQAGVENVVALADVDWARGRESFERFPKAVKFKDFRQMLEKQGKEIDAVVVGPPDHMHTICAMACMQHGKHVYGEKPLPRLSGEARLLAQAAEKYKVATQMGNQGYSHDATRVACEIFWSGEIGDVKEVHAWTRRAAWPQGMTKIPPPTPIPVTLDWDLWLGCADSRPYTAGDKEYEDFVAARNARSGRGPAVAAAPGRGGGGRSLSAEDPLIQLAPQGGGFYMPWNWRGHYDFGSGLIGDWGVHILGPAYWALQLHPK